MNSFKDVKKINRLYTWLDFFYQRIILRIVPDTFGILHKLIDLFRYIQDEGEGTISPF